MNCVDCLKEPPEYGKVRCSACRMAYLAGLDANRAKWREGRERKKRLEKPVDEQARIAYEEFMEAAEAVNFAAESGVDLWRPTLVAEMALRRLVAAFRRAGVPLRGEDGLLVY